MFKPIHIFIGLCIFTAMSIGAFAQFRSPNAGKTPGQAVRAPSITVMTVKPHELVATLAVTGTLVPRDEIRVMSQIDNLSVTEIKAEEGDHVQEGQVLLKLDDIMLRSQLAQSNANLARAEATNVEAQKALLRTQELRKKGFATQEQLDLRISVAKVAAAEETAQRAQHTEFATRVARTDVKAPIAGVVAKRMAVVGMIAMPTQPLYTMIAKGEIELQAQVADTQHKFLAPKQHAKIFSSSSNQPIDGIVRLVSPQIDPLTRLGDVRVSIPGENNFAVGSFARAMIETARKTALAVPLSAISYQQDQASVLLVVDDKAQIRNVRLGIMAEGYAEVTEGLQEGDVIVLKAGTFLRDGDRITPVKAE